MDRKVSIIEDLDGKKTVVIHDIRFKGKRTIDWEEVKSYIRQYVGEFYEMTENGEKVFIGADLPNEYIGSEYTFRLKGAILKAKANAVQGIPELIETAHGGNHKQNNAEKHSRNAKYGWYRYDSRFALPVFYESGEVERYNVFHASLIIRHDEDGNKYLYDIIDIKKEMSTPLGS